HVEKWSSWAGERQMSVEFEYWGHHEIFVRLSQEEHRGRYFFWFNKEAFTEQWFEGRVAEALAAAGPRYTPELNVNLPVARAFEGLSRTEAFFADIRVLRGNLARRCSGLRRAVLTESDKELFKSLLDQIGSLLPLLVRAE